MEIIFQENQFFEKLPTWFSEFLSIFEKTKDIHTHIPTPSGTIKVGIDMAVV